MREVAPGDLIFSFADTYIRAIGIARSTCYECPKPNEFGVVGAYWDQIGWKVDVEFRPLGKPLRPVEHMDVLRRTLPEKYSALSVDGRGSQSVYLTTVPPPMANALARLIGHEARIAMDAGKALAQDVGLSDRPAKEIAEWEEHLRSKIEKDVAIPETTREQLVLARRGQGKFRDAVSQIEKHCRITKVNRPEHLIASHCKPWRDCKEHAERLDGENGLLLTPSIDHLFDRGFISFENNSSLLISPVAHEFSMRKMGIPIGEKVNVGSFTEGQRRYLEYHREAVFLQAVRKG
jgi:hypothetical protein